MSRSWYVLAALGLFFSIYEGLAWIAVEFNVPVSETSFTVIFIASALSTLCLCSLAFSIHLRRN